MDIQAITTAGRVARVRRALIKKSCPLAILAIGCMLVLTGVSKAKDLRAAIGKTVYVTTIRSHCAGGAAPDLSWLRARLKHPLRFGSLVVGPPFEKNANPRYAAKCPNKRLWMRRLYYRGAAKGTEVIGIDFPDSGLITWTVHVR